MTWPAMSLADAGVAVLDCEHRTPRAADAGHPYIAIPEIRGGVAHVDESRRIASADLQEWTRRTKPVVGDIVVTRRARVGDTAPIPVDDAAIGQNLVILRSVGSTVDQRYLRWAVRSPTWWQEVEKWRNVGAVFTSLNVKDIAKMAIPIPPLPIQRAIAGVLGALDDKIAANERVADSADALVRALYEGLGAAETVSVGDLFLNPRNAAKPPIVADAHVGLEHLPRRSMWLNHAGCVDGLLSGKFWFDRDDVLFGKLRPYFHKVVVSDRRGVCSTDILVLRTRRPEWRGYCWAAVTSDAVVQRVSAMSAGTKMPRTNWADLASCEVRWPGGSAACLLSERVVAVRDRVAAAVVESRKLAELRDTLLPHLMSGRITVRDAETQLEEVL